MPQKVLWRPLGPAENVLRHWGTTKKCGHEDSKLMFILIQLSEMYGLGTAKEYWKKGRIWMNEWMHEQSEFILMGRDTIVGVFTSLL